MSTTRARIRAKIWLEKNGNPILGGGGAELLRHIEKEGSLTKAAGKMRLSYRGAWGQIKEMSAALGADLVHSIRGGASGGETKLTDAGKKILREYGEISSALEKIAAEEHFWEAIGVKMSARNQLMGEITDIETDRITAKIKMKIAPTEITAVITKEAAEDLELKKGDKAKAVIKSTEIIITKE
jgi:molybdate transport system regulatory protein